jgi:hypothetical protein
VAGLHGLRRPSGAEIDTPAEKIWEYVAPRRKHPEQGSRAALQHSRRAGCGIMAAPAQEPSGHAIPAADLYR